MALGQRGPPVLPTQGCVGASQVKALAAVVYRRLSIRRARQTDQVAMSGNVR